MKTHNRSRVKIRADRISLPTAVLLDYLAMTYSRGHSDMKQHIRDSMDDFSKQSHAGS
jgi:hypothetical protein